jgi:hypothetical protein
MTPTAAPAAEDIDTGPDSRDVDKVLGELVALGGRWALFRRFVWGRIMVNMNQRSRNVQLTWPIG